MPDHRLVFGHTAEGLFIRGLKVHQRPVLKAKLKAAGFDADQKMEPASPYDAWCRFLDVAISEQPSGSSRDEALTRMGEALAEGSFVTVVGKALLALVKVIGPRRALARMRQNFRTGNNDSESKFEELGPGHCRPWLNERDHDRAMSRGTIRKGVELAGAKNLTVEIAAFDDTGTTSEAKWTP